MSEQDFKLGYDAALRNVMLGTMQILQPNTPPEAHLIVERNEVVEKLREVCELVGDNNWEKDLYLPDVLERHLLPYLRD